MVSNYYDIFEIVNTLKLFDKHYIHPIKSLHISSNTGSIECIKNIRNTPKLSNCNDIHNILFCHTLNELQTNILSQDSLETENDFLYFNDFNDVLPVVHRNETFIYEML